MKKSKTITISLLGVLLFIPFMIPATAAPAAYVGVVEEEYYEYTMSFNWADWTTSGFIADGISETIAAIFGIPAGWSMQEMYDAWIYFWGTYTFSWWSTSVDTILPENTSTFLSDYFIFTNITHTPVNLQAAYWHLFGYVPDPPGTYIIVNDSTNFALQSLYGGLGFSPMTLKYTVPFAPNNTNWAIFAATAQWGMDHYWSAVSPLTTNITVSALADGYSMYIPTVGLENNTSPITVNVTYTSTGALDTATFEYGSYLLYAFELNTYYLDVVTPEIIASPSDFSLPDDYMGESISWIATDAHPGNYTITRDVSTTVVPPTPWVNGTAVTYNITDGLSVGNHTFEISFEDLYGNSINDTVILTVFILDTMDPVITSTPSDVVADVGVYGDIFSWTATDTNAGTYTITRNGTEVVAPTPWVSGAAVIFEIPWIMYYILGVTTYEITFTDISGNNVSDSVLMTVVIPDTTNPVITDTSSDFSVDHNYTGVTINWTATDVNPANYTVLMNGGSVVIPTPWISGVGIQYAVPDGLIAGDYVFQINFADDNGNLASSNVTMTVRPILLPPPGDFALSSDADFPDDGFLNLSWTTSDEADNYSIYMHNSLITQINGSLTTMANQNATSPFAIIGLSSGEYYFVVVAHNQYGDMMSNNIHVTVQIPPDSFVLSSDVELPDDDGIFNLIWTTSDWADNYSIYMHNNVITQINGSLTTMANQNATSPFAITGLSSDEYYFVVVAHNQYGDTMANNVHVSIQIPPDSFVLSSDAYFPDDDGIFNLIWSTSDLADNYSIYMYDNLITQINGSLTIMASQNATLPFAIAGLSSGEYYFVVVAYNQYGDMMSNNIQIIVQIPPGSSVLSSDADFPDDDGIFNLIWTTSDLADNYSIYMHNNVIKQINGSLTIITSQNAASPFAITGLSSGEYYFVVVAHNQYGDTISNNIQIIVQIPPSSFVLRSDADFPDDDGIFNLIWTTSEGADNYSIYLSNTPITVINNSLTLLLEQITASTFTVSGLPTGEYYFVVVAYNQYGDIMSNNLHVSVIKPGGPNSPGIPGYNTLVILGIAITTSVILFKRKKLKYKLR